MGELIFIGLGLHDATDISVKGLLSVKEADKVFAEFYTAKLIGASLEDLISMFEREVKVLDREEVEDGAIILKPAIREKVVLLCVGDPMTATTHVDLRLRAIDQGIDTRVVHGQSILTAAASLLGLQHYKFGRTTTIPYPHDGYRPQSPYDVIVQNMEKGLHTLVLLDIDDVNERLMSANEALEILLDIDEERSGGALTDPTLVCVVGRAGSDAPTVRCGLLKEIKEEDLGPPHHCIVIPGRLHFKEAEALVKLAGAPKEIMDD